MFAFILPFVLFFLNLPPIPAGVNPYRQDGNLTSIYLVKQKWHTGIVIPRMAIDTTIWKFSGEMGEVSYIDAGWGDAEFYQHVGFDELLAVKALFYPTTSALRLEGINNAVEDYTNSSDAAVMLYVNEDQMDILCLYIQQTYEQDNNINPILLNERNDGRIKYYLAKGKYHLLNTCNTWISKALHLMGFDINESLVLAEQLFKELSEIGIRVK